MSIRVLHSITHFSLGGAEEVMLSIVAELRAEASFGVVATCSPPQNVVGDRMIRTLRSYDVPIWVGRSRGAGPSLGGMSVIRRAVHEFRPDIVHLHTEIPEAYFALARWTSPGFRSVRVVRTIHNTRYWFQKRRVGRFVDRAIGPCRVVAVSNAASKAYSRFQGGNTVAAEVIHNGVEMSPAPVRVESRPSGNIRALFAGRLEEQKGADLLPSILNRVHLPAGVSLHVDVVGQGTFSQMLTENRRALGGATVTVHPPIACLRDELHRYDLVLMPSRFEGLGLIAVEAIMAGVPVVITDAPGLVETVPSAYPYVARAGDAGSFAEMVTMALATRAEWPRHVSAAVVLCRERFSPEIMGRRYLSVYNDVMGRDRLS